MSPHSLARINIFIYAPPHLHPQQLQVQLGPHVLLHPPLSHSPLATSNDSNFLQIKFKKISSINLIWYILIVLENIHKKKKLSYEILLKLSVTYVHI